MEKDKSKLSAARKKVNFYYHWLLVWTLCSVK